MNKSIIKRRTIARADFIQTVTSSQLRTTSSTSPPTPPTNLLQNVLLRQPAKGMPRTCQCLWRTLRKLQAIGSPHKHSSSLLSRHPNISPAVNRLFRSRSRVRLSPRLNGSQKLVACSHLRTRAHNRTRIACFSGHDACLLRLPHETPSATYIRCGDDNHGTPVRLRSV